MRADRSKSETRGSLSGATHRYKVDIKNAVVGSHGEAALHECECGVDVTLDTYRDALGRELPATVQTVMEQQSLGLRQNHDQIKRLHDQVCATSQRIIWAQSEQQAAAV